MRKANIIYLTCVFTLGATGCSRTNFPAYAALGDLRVLTIIAQADQGEVNPGTTVTLQPIVSDLNAGGRTLTATVSTCPDPGIALGAAPTCAHPDTTTTSTFSSSSLGSVGTFTGAAPTFTVAIPANPINLLLASANLKYNGVAYLILYTLTAADGSSVAAFKRIVVSDPGKTTKNKNPAIGPVIANGTPLAATQAYNGAATDLAISYTAGAETYSLMNADGSLTTQTESLTTTWFYTDGKMKFNRTVGTDGNHWEPDRPPSRGVTLVVVTHDGRGGEDYKQFDFN